MISILTFAGLGFALGLRHALDPDHVMAVTTLVAHDRRPREALRLGLLWGLGHTLTILLLGGAIVVFKLSIPAGVAAAFEFAVGVMLVVLGGLTLLGMRLGSGAVHSHSHSHGGTAHRHLHAHGVPRFDLSKARGARALAVGVVHGLAGSAALALMVLAAIPGPAAGLAYLMVFCAGTLSGMAALSAVLGWTLRRAAEDLALGPWLQASVGLASLAFGFSVMYNFGRLIE